MNRFRLVALAVVLELATLPLPAQSIAADSAYRALGRDILRELIEINTTMPAGNVTTASEKLAARFRAAGFPSEDVMVIGAGEKSKNLVVRWRGRDMSRKPVLFLAHLDVVEARREDWSFDPFTFIEKDGWFYGRGTLDDKGGAAQIAAALLRLRAEGFVPERSITLALTAGEESGIDNGVEWLLTNRRELVDAEYVFNVDAGGGELRNGRPVAATLQSAEKVFYTFTFTSRNSGGHSSLPRPDNAIYRLTAALERLSRYQFPIRVTPVAREYLTQMAPIVGGSTAAAMRAVLARPNDAAAVATLTKSPYYNAILRTTCVATMLTGGHAENALPQMAEATVNCRMLPDEDTAAVRKTLMRVVADTSIVVAPRATATLSPASPLRADIVDAVGRATEAAWQKVPVVPVMETGATDGLYFRNAGIPVYAFLPLFIDFDDIRAHGRDERISVEEFGRGLEFSRRLIADLTGAKALRP